jgi:hypothetical protein
MIDNFLIELSNNKLFGGCLMLLTNIGSRYITMEFPDNIEKLFSTSQILRYLVFFSIFFMATRDVKTSILLSLLFFIIIKYAINEKSSFCIINNKSENNISYEEYNKAKEIITNYEKKNNYA